MVIITGMIIHVKNNMEVHGFTHWRTAEREGERDAQRVRARARARERERRQRQRDKETMRERQSKERESDRWRVSVSSQLKWKKPVFTETVVNYKDRRSEMWQGVVR